ncbi:MAG: GspE/PulE family protein [Patescibacteria group bacterium]
MSPKIYDIVPTEKRLHDIRSIVELADALIAYGYHRNASDIHIDPSAEHIMVRFRIDGVLIYTDTLARDLHETLIARIKVMSGLRTDIHFVPQDGRFRFAQSMCDCDVRVSIVPTHYGENAVLRILRQTRKRTTLSELGFSAYDIERIVECLSYHQGMILVTGPTGSGKTSTLYTLIGSLATESASIITLEDPVEYAMEGVRQIQIQAKHGITFATGLRSIVRQDPDIIMVGEIRDPETAQIATNISLTGHLLLSTLHTNSALGAIPRLIDMGVDPYLVASTLSLVIAQRLVRKVCVVCKGEKCSLCGGTGYKGRTVVAETFVVDEEIRRYIMSRLPLGELSRYVHSKGMKSMYEDGMEKVEQGITSKEEILRILHE